MYPVNHIHKMITIIKSCKTTDQLNNCTFLFTHIKDRYFHYLLSSATMIQFNIIAREKIDGLFTSLSLFGSATIKN